MTLVSNSTQRQGSILMLFDLVHKPIRACVCTCLRDVHTVVDLRVMDCGATKVCVMFSVDQLFMVFPRVEREHIVWVKVDIKLVFATIHSQLLLAPVCKNVIQETNPYFVSL